MSSCNQNLNKSDFARTFAVIATLANVALTPDLLEFYYNELSAHSHDDVMRALKEFARSTSPRTGLPTVHAISEKVCPTRTERDEAADISTRIIASISKYGWNNSELARKYIGEIGWIVVNRLGGWRSFCEQSDTTALSYLEKMARDIARVVLIDAASPKQRQASLPGSKEKMGKVLELVRSLSEGNPFESKDRD